MAKFQKGFTYQLVTNFYKNRWDVDQKKDVEAPKTTEITVFRSEEAYLKNEQPIKINLDEKTTLFVVEEKTARNGDRLVYGLFGGAGGWTCLESRNWKKIRYEEMLTTDSEETKSEQLVEE